jgi:hypothetical protein
MAAPILRVHQNQGGKVEGIQWMVYAAGQTFKAGELVKFDGSGNIIIMDSSVASGTIVGVALQDADSAPGFSAANSPTTFTYRSQKVSVCRPNDQTIFQAIMTNNSSTRVNPALTDVGIQYGLTAYNTAAAGAVWTVDKNKTAGNARVTVVGIDTDQNVVFFKFIASFLA